jgi:hypothetical protein
MSTRWKRARNRPAPRPFGSSLAHGSGALFLVPLSSGVLAVNRSGRENHDANQISRDDLPRKKTGTGS